MQSAKAVGQLSSHNNETALSCEPHRNLKYKVQQRNIPPIQKVQLQQRNFKQLSEQKLAKHQSCEPLLHMQDWLIRIRSWNAVHVKIQRLAVQPAAVEQKTYAACDPILNTWHIIWLSNVNQVQRHIDSHPFHVLQLFEVLTFTRQETMMQQ